jgi:hypothetical protein
MLWMCSSKTCLPTYNANDYLCLYGNLLIFGTSCCKRWCVHTFWAYGWHSRVLTRFTYTDWVPKGSRDSFTVSSLRSKPRAQRYNIWASADQSLSFEDGHSSPGRPREHIDQDARGLSQRQLPLSVCLLLMSQLLSYAHPSMVFTPGAFGSLLSPLLI